MLNQSSRPDKPGWLFIDRYMPGATPQEQEEAYENLRSLVQLLLQIDERLVTEEAETQKMLQPPLF
jgi:hypothetical protein